MATDAAAPTTFRAARVEGFGGPEVLRVASLPAFGRCADDEVLVDVAASVVSPLDTYLRRGVQVGAYAPQPPYTPGGAFAGTVRAVGAAVRQLAPGDRVYGRARSGANAEQALCAADRVYPLPDGIDLADAALIVVPYETAYHALVDLGRAEGGQTVLVPGAAGSVGAAAVQLALDRGLRVIATCAAHDVARIAAMGVLGAFDYRREDLRAAVLDATGGRGVDIVVEIAARQNLALDLAVAAPGGRIVIVGGPGPTPFDALPVIGRGLVLAGVDLTALRPERAQQIHATLRAGLAGGRLRPHAAHRHALERIADAHRAVEGAAGGGGVVLVSAP